MKRTTLWALLATLAAAAAVYGALLLFSHARERARQTQVGRVVVEHIPDAQLPVPARTEEWFVGDWAGLIAGGGQPDPEWTDFGMATLQYYNEQCCLLRIYRTPSGYEAALGSSLWRVTGHDMGGVFLTCTQATSRYVMGPDSLFQEFYEFGEGQTMRLTYSEERKSSVPAAQVPERHILTGEVPEKEGYGWKHCLLLSLLPPGAQRADDSGIYPCWYGGYEAMAGDFKGMFCLGVNGRGKRIFGQVLDRGDGAAIVLGAFDGAEYDRTRFYAPRDMRAENLTQLYAMQDADGLFFPQFMRYDADGLPGRWSNVSGEHKLYYEAEYIPRLRSEIAALRAQPQDIWTRRQILARQGFIEYAQRLIYGDFDGICSLLLPHIPQMVQSDAKYRDEVSLAGLKPGDTLADAQALYDLHELKPEEEQRFGLIGLFRGNTQFYTDGKGLLLLVYPGSSGRIGTIELHRPGYATPDGRQPGDAFERGKLLLYAKDAVLSYGDASLAEGVDTIGVIRMSVVLDRVWDETFLDMDGDGAKERLTLSGRCTGSYLEQPPALCDYQSGIVEEFDFGTKATLRVYKDDALIHEEILPIAMYYLLPQFCGKLQTNVPGDVYIVSETGGTGLEEPIYCVSVKGGKSKTKYLGMIDIYS